MSKHMNIDTYPCPTCGRDVAERLNHFGGKFIGEPRHWISKKDGKRVAWSSHVCPSMLESAAAAAEAILRVRRGGAR